MGAGTRAEGILNITSDNRKCSIREKKANWCQKKNLRVLGPASPPGVLKCKMHTQLMANILSKTHKRARRLLCAQNVFWKMKRRVSLIYTTATTFKCLSFDALEGSGMDEAERSLEQRGERVPPRMVGSTKCLVPSLLYDLLIGSRSVLGGVFFWWGGGGRRGGCGFCE